MPRFETLFLITRKKKSQVCLENDALRDVCGFTRGTGEGS